jgi:bifunctional non-homologous end joining protein LigD
MDLLSHASPLARTGRRQDPAGSTRSSYRLQVRRQGDAVRLFTRRGYDWSGRYPAIVVTAMQLRATSFTLDGEAVVCGPDGVAIFDALHRRGTVSEAMLYAFDLLEFDGDDLRAQPLGDRKKRLARLLGKRRLAIVLSEHTDEDGALIFQQACKLGLEGIVSKRLSAPYRSGPSRDWIKVKNPDSPAMIRAREAEWWQNNTPRFACRIEPMDLANTRQNGVRSLRGDAPRVAASHGSSGM